MPGKAINDLGELQRAIMEIIWDQGEATVREVRDRLRKRNRHAYTSVLSTMQKLEKLGWLKHRPEGRTYIYRATRTREQEGTNSLRRFLDDVFGGNPLRLVQHLMDDKSLSKEDLAALRKMIEQRRKEA